MKEQGNNKRTPAQERRIAFRKTFFASVPVRIGFIIICVIAFAAIFAPLVAPY